MRLHASLHYAVRTLQKSWGFGVLFIVTLAFGLAAVNTIFSVVNSVILRPLPFKNPERLVAITETVPFLGSGPQVCTLDEFQRWQKSGLLEKAAAVGTSELTLSGEGRTELLTGARVTPDFFAVFQISPLLGRAFRPEDAAPGRENVIILSHELWARRFAGDPSIVGKAVSFSGATLTVIGVAPPRFDFPRLADVGAVMHFAPEHTEFWTPLVITQKLIDRNYYSYYLIGRLRTGISPTRAAAEFKVLAVQSLQYIVERNPQYREPLEHLAKRIAIQVMPLSQSMALGVRGALWMLFASVALLLLLVLFNFGNLLITRNANRLREYTIRQALGQSRGQLFCQALAEQSVLMTLACGLSVILSGWALELIRNHASLRMPRLYELSFDWHALMLLIAVALLIMLAFGALPLLVLSGSVASSMRTESRTTTADRRSTGLRSALVGAEISVSLVLLVSAGLLAASFFNVLNVNPGFNPRNLLTFNISFSAERYTDAPKMLTEHRELLNRLRALPGVESASVINVLPLTGDDEIHGIGLPGKPLNREAGAEARLIDPQYFTTMHIPLVAGRVLRDDDSSSVAVINQRMARLLWPAQNPLGRAFTDNGNPPIRVVGVVGDVHSGPLETQPMMQYYLPLAAFPGYANSFALRTQTDPLTLLPTVEKVIWRFDPAIAISGAGTMEHIIQSATLERRWETDLLLGFSASALLLSALGLFGVASLSVARRSREFGIRIALGASGVNVLWLEIARNTAIVIPGLLIGLSISLAIHRALAAFLFGISALNPIIYAAAAALLAFTALAALLIPALRAARLDPAIVLRDD